jgi:hypothetical protein
MRAEIVPLGDRRGAVDLLANATDRILNYYRGLLGHEEPISLLQVWFRDGNWETGEAYERSYAAVWPEPPQAKNVIIWSDTIAHELFHLWNGHAIAAIDGPGSQWFVEGMTEYVANLAALRSGVIPRTDFFRLMEKHLFMYWCYVYNRPWERLSLVEAGSNKSDYNAAIYDGGWLVAFCIDVQLREATRGERSVDDLMSLLYERFGVTATPYTNEDLFAAVNDVSGTDLSAFFEQHVTGTRTIPFRSFLERAGCDATVSGHVVVVRGATEDKSIFEAILSGR